MSGIRITVTDINTGDSETVEIENDYVVICQGDRHVAHTRFVPTTGTHIITIKKRTVTP